jgi:hypothetical protein
MNAWLDRAILDCNVRGAARERLMALPADDGSP